MLADEQGHQHRSNAGAAPQPRQQYAQPQQAPPAAAAPVDPFGTQLNNPFGALLGGGMFGAIPGGVVMRGNGNFFSSSTVISSGPGGVYHSSTTSRQAPGGVSDAVGQQCAHAAVTYAEPHVHAFTRQ